MTERLYYSDSYTTRFTAKILQRDMLQGKLALVLDRTYFYPESGGQPADHGQLGSALVTDVQIRASDGAILHQVAGDVWESDQIEGIVDWDRRYDHMQQHSGQHILSQAFLRVAEAQTLSFHLGEGYVSIDIPNHGLTGQHIEQAEMLANETIWKNRAIRAFLITKEEIEGLPLRKVPDVDEDSLRIIEIDEFDLSACGGTHVRQTGEVGQIKIVRLERRRANLRVYFQCGKRALLDYRYKNSILSRLSSDLTSGIEDIGPIINKLQSELKDASKRIKSQQEQLAVLEAERLRVRHPPSESGLSIIVHVVHDQEMPYLRMLANQLIEQPGTIVLLGAAGENARLLFARHEDAPGAMDELLRATLSALGSSAGGGKASFAQGGGGEADEERLQTALERARRLLIGQLD